MATIAERLKDTPRRLIILAACGFARAAEHLLVDQRSRDALDSVERVADGQAIAEESWRAAEPEAHAAAVAWSAVEPKTHAEKAVWRAAGAAAGVAIAVVWAAVEAEAALEKTWKTGWEAARLAAEAQNQSILDCILPARITFVSPPHVKGLAATIYQKRDWSLMPILADALEEIGQAEMAAHCRHLIHAKGCHALDSILGDRFH